MTKPNYQTKKSITKNIEFLYFSVITGLTGVILPDGYKRSIHHSGLY